MDPNANPAPAAAPEAAPAPAPAPAAPETPAAPAAPETPPAADPAASKLTPEEAAAKAEDDEWAEATKQQFGELENKEGSKKNEPAKSKEEPKTPEADPANPDGKKPDEKSGDGDGAEAKTAQTPTADDLARQARAAARQTAEQTQAVIADVREKMFKDAPTQMVDSDGDPIQTVQDVMNLINPATGKAFTEEEAYPWLLAAQQKFNETVAARESQIKSIAETNIAIKAEADYVNAKYGDILKNDTALRDKLWAQFEKTLVKDEATGIITKMPVSLEEFYELALEGRQAPAKAAETPAVPPAAPGADKLAEGAPTAPATPDPAKAAADKAAAEAKAKEDAERQRQQNRADRSDIYTPPADPKVGSNKEDDEWAQATKDYYGDRLK